MTDEAILAARLAAWADRSVEVVGQLARGPAEAVLREAVESFAAGLRAALAGRAPEGVARPAIAREGVGMGAALLDALRPGPRRLEAALAGPRPEFVALGAGMAAARLGRDALPPAIGDLAAMGWDGWGFQRALLAPHRLRGPARLGAGGEDALVGAGRALWFLTAGDAGAIAARVARIDEGPRDAVLCGVGVAGAFAGGATDATRITLGALGDAWTAGHARGARHRREAEPIDQAS